MPTQAFRLTSENALVNALAQVGLGSAIKILDGDRGIIAWLESALTHPDTGGDGFIREGTPCLLTGPGKPGIAAASASAATQYVPVQTKGIYKLAVKGADGSGNAAIAYGAKVYYDAGEINADVTNGTLFGYWLGSPASNTLTSGATVNGAVMLAGTI